MDHPDAATYCKTAQPRVFARLPAVIVATGLGRSTIYRLVARGDFPQPVQLGPRAVAWRWADLDAWSASRSSSVRRERPGVIRRVDHGCCGSPAEA